MRTRLLFYKTENTEVNEKIVRNSLAKYGVALSGSVSAYSPIELMHALSAAVEISELILIVGGLELPGRDNIVRVLSQALGIYAEEAGRSRSDFIIDPIHSIPQPTLAGSKVLRNRLDGPSGIAIDSGTQCIICLPGHEAQLSDMLNGDAAEHFTARYGLTEASMFGNNNIGLQKHDSIENTLNLVSFGENYNNEASIESEKIKIHGRKKNRTRSIILKVVLAVIILAVVIAVSFISCNIRERGDGDYIAKSPFSQSRTV